jgi:23S rRNA pseudouridine1911/1915/1917 synthase
MSFFDHQVPPEAEGQRIDRYLSAELEKDWSRSDVQRWLKEGLVSVDGRAAAKNRILREGNHILIESVPAKPGSQLEPEEIPLDIVYEDDTLAVINKPKNLVVHPGSGISTGTLAAGLLFHYKQLSQCNGEDRPGIVHRLDKDTSGLMVVARNDVAHRHLSEQLQRRDLKRTYRALIWGHLDPFSGSIEGALARDPHHRMRMRIHPDGRFARTHYSSLRCWNQVTELQLQLDTGRTHQIRVHLQSRGCSIIGDPLYGGREASLNRLEHLERNVHRPLLRLSQSQLLQACQLDFTHPATGEAMHFEIPPEDEYAQVLQFLNERFGEGRPPEPS